MFVIGYTLGRVEGFWNLHLAHPKMDSGWESKTKIEKTFFIILSSFRSRLVFVKKNGPNPPNKVRIFSLSKYDVMGIKKFVILWRFRKSGRSLVTKCT